MSLSARILEAINAAGLSQRKVADAMGVTRSAVNNWVKDRVDPSSANLRELATVTNVSYEWLAMGADDVNGENNLKGARGLISVPKLDYLAAGQLSDSVKVTTVEKNYPTTQIGFQPDLGPQSFALDVENDAMAPTYRIGDEIIVDPDATIVPGDHVIAVTSLNDRAVFLKYSPSGYDKNQTLEISLQPLNPDHPTVKIDRDNPGRIVGKVVRHTRYL